MLEGGEICDSSALELTMVKRGAQQASADVHQRKIELPDRWSSVLAVTQNLVRDERKFVSSGSWKRKTELARLATLVHVGHLT